MFLSYVPILENILQSESKWLTELIVLEYFELFNFVATIVIHICKKK